MRSEPDAGYAEVFTVDCSRLSPMVAAPGDPGNGIALDGIGAPVKVDIAYGGSCTAGKREDFDHYHAVLAWAVENKLRVAPGVQLYLQYGTTAVRDYCVSRGYDRTIDAVGARILQPSCGACANCGPSSSTSRVSWCRSRSSSDGLQHRLDPRPAARCASPVGVRRARLARASLPSAAAHGRGCRRFPAGRGSPTGAPHA